MKKLAFLFVSLSLYLSGYSQGWPADYEGVMLQGFYWDSYSETSWSKLKAQASDIAPFFKLVWVPQSGWCNSDYNQMGYTPVYYFDQRSSFGSEAQLRRMIEAFREKGTGVIADVVINHRNNMGVNGSWVDYPAETYKGETYQMLPSDICSNDDGGQTYSWATGKGITLSPNNDTGEDWSGCRDLDHQSENVQKCIKAYLKFLIEDVGYTGFRYDMVKGFYASYVADYNMHAKPAFSVGEYWDSSQKIREWINHSRGYVSETPTSAAFDFQFRYRVRDAINNKDWRWLGWDEKPISTDNYYKQYAVTFVENHDTEHRSNGAEQDPIRSDTLAANAYLLAMPGTPCVFYTHWRDHKYALKQMILARKLAGISNTSVKEEKASAKDYYASITTGKNGTLLSVVGNKPQSYYVNKTQYTEILSGKGYRYFMNRSANTVWMDVPDGTYDDHVDVTLTAVSNLSDAKIVYTVDGTNPTAQSSQLTSGSTLRIDASCTLKAAILSNGNTLGTQTRQYNIFKPHDITIHVSSDISWAAMAFYIWDNSNNQLNGNWPGKRITSTQNIDGKRCYYQTLRITSSEQYFNLVITNTSGNRQTIDVTDIYEDCYLNIPGTKEGTKYEVIDQTPDIQTGIEVPTHSILCPKSKTAFTLEGTPVHHARKKGLVIEKGRKTLYR